MHAKPLGIAYMVLCVCIAQAQQQGVCQRRCNGSILTEPSDQGVSFVVPVGYIRRTRTRARTITNPAIILDFARCGNVLSVMEEMPDSYPVIHACSFQGNGNITCTFPKHKCYQNSMREPIDAILRVQVEQEDRNSYRRTITSALDNQQSENIGTEGQDIHSIGCFVQVLCQSFHTLQIQTSASSTQSQNYTFQFHVSFECTNMSGPCNVAPSMLSAKLLVFYGLADECTSRSCSTTSS